MVETAPRPGALISTIYGAFVRPCGGWVPIADLITLMADLDVDAPAVRSAISRLKKRGILTQERGTGPRAGTGYRLTPVLGPVFDEGDRRILGGLEPAALEDGWVVAVFSVPETERAARHQLRSRLTWLGFGKAAPGVWVAPRRLLADARATLGRVGLSDYVHLFAGAYAGFDDLASVVGTWWDFKAIEDQYAEFTAAYRPLATELRPPVAEDEAFRAYVPMLTAWRRLPYLDPGLPAELLPADWNAVEARRLFQELHALLATPSLRHVEAVTGLRAT
ncbi:PaaX family transcriptional regulator [Yinghuangia seranimata]|uniref:PaaX family transcriptional regulator n=1 Tax=Yinghuangia seranimata TaxID=408067 RepID=UPI00248ABC8B|nr:PaaX family transcriptional regulator C-terminal domain-containing protein [Yinghuangia seranimata]MDI2129929.1 PaaX family transcriptional regulator C-terminal domain-containing protein [Yinghuangia seranimata]